MRFRERIRRWWKPGEYDDEHPVDDNTGHPLSAEERDEEKSLSFQDEIGKLEEPLDPESDLRPPA